MDSILVRGNGPLKGAIPIAGAKNACLTLMPATLLSDEPLTLTNAPRLSDIKTMTHDGKPFTGSVGDTVFLCFASVSSHGSGSYLPAEFRDRVLGSGFASRIKGPPRIAFKTKWNPIHLVGRSLLRSVAREGRWPLDDGVTVLSHLFIERDLGSGRYEIRLDEPHSLGRASELTFLLDVPSGLKGRERLGTGEWVWVIMSRPVIDKQLRKLILTAEDLETSYVDAVDEPK